MARPGKDGIDYFPLDVHLDEEFDLIEAEFGLIGFAVVVKLFQKIYGGKGYYCEWTKDVALLFGKKCGFNPGDNVVSEIVRASINRGIFNSDLFDKYGILTSKGIQERYFEAVNRRKKVEVKGAHLLVNADEIPDNVYINSENVYINSKNADINSQSKVKESKVNKSKVNNICADTEKTASAPEQVNVIELMLNDKSLFGVTQENIDHWKELYPAVNIEQELRKMKGWLEANPAKRKTRRGINRFIIGWLSKVQDRGGNAYGNDRIANGTTGGIAQNDAGVQPKYGIIL